MAKLRWKMTPKETGLRSIGACPRGYVYHDGLEEYATVNPNGGGWSSVQSGWYWVAFHRVPYENTCYSPVPTAEAAKKAAEEYVRKHLTANADNTGRATC